MTALEMTALEKELGIISMCLPDSPFKNKVIEVHAKCQEEIKRLHTALQDIAEMTDADNPESYRCDDREGCFDTVFATATTAMTPNA